MTTVLITGGSAGIGRELALAFARRGDEVLAVGRDHERLQKLAASHPGIAPIKADVSSDEGQETIQRALDGAELDVFVSGAALCWVAPVEVQTSQQIRETCERLWRAPFSPPGPCFHC